MTETGSGSPKSQLQVHSIKWVEKVRADFLMEIPGADLLLSKPYEELMAGVLESKHIGQGVVETAIDDPQMRF